MLKTSCAQFLGFQAAFAVAIVLDPTLPTPADVWLIQVSSSLYCPEESPLEQLQQCT